MNRLMYLILLAPVVPFIGALWNHIAAYVGVGLAWAILLGALLNIEDLSFRLLLFAQVPLMMLVSYLSIRYGIMAKERNSAEEIESPVEDLSPEHAALKQEVARSEKDEDRSLQIYAAAKNLAEALSWKDMAPRLTAAIQKIFGGYEFLLFAFEGTDERTLLHRRGSWSEEFPLKDMIPDSARFFRPPQTSEVVPILVVPIFTGEGEGYRMNGLLILKSPGGNRTEEEILAAGHEFGEELGMALDKALLFAQMEKQSRTDGLTGVLRRQVFMDRLEEEFKRASVFHTPFSLMMVDIDHFKAVNDAHGHGAGDEVLRKLGDILKSSVYETDIVGRYGGEEFILLMPKAQRDGVLRKAEAIRQRIQRESILFGFTQIKITVSIGVAHFPTSARSSPDLIGCADRMLYQAKETGRNRVCEG
ncbi:hypothetical protein BVX98_01205 [bacterium F11]|nr:hypothetical protein BVX98_01205 [bacterium F11]